MNTTRRALKEAYQAIDYRKGEEVRILDVSRISSFTDYFVICHGSNEKQNQAICDAVRERLKEAFQLSPSNIEGYQEADWILVDYLTFVVHIFSPTARRHYDLEQLWCDGEEIQPKALTA